MVVISPIKSSPSFEICINWGKTDKKYFFNRSKWNQIENLEYPDTPIPCESSEYVVCVCQTFTNSQHCPICVFSIFTETKEFGLM